MRAYGLTVMIGGAACMVAGSVTATNAQEAARQRAPIVRVYSSGAVDVIGTPTYITPEIRLSENAYLFAVALDLDGNIRVLFPELPGISVKVSSHTQLRLPNFFVGFNRQNGSVHDGYYANGHYTSGYDGYVDDTRGTVVALASRVPFNLDVISRGGDWDFSAIRLLLEHRTPQDAALVLSRYLGAQGEPIGYDYFRFSGGSANSYYADGYGYYGNGAYDYGYYDYNGYYNGYNGYAPFLPYAGPGSPSNRRRHPSDTTVFPKLRLPAEGHFPVPGRAGGPQHNVIVTAPSRRSEPRTVEAYRNDPGGMTAPQGRMPIERQIPQTEPGAAMGAMPTRYPSPPRVEAAPAPARMPERTYSAPVVERPSSPPPPRVISTPAYSAPTYSAPTHPAPVYSAPAHSAPAAQPAPAQSPPPRTRDQQ